MAFNKLRIKDKEIFDRYLKLSTHQLSVYSFANIYIWNKFFDISWKIIDDSLCIFFKDKIGAFLYLPPLSKENNPKVLVHVFEILSKSNKNNDFAHIENVEEKDLGFYRSLGFRCTLKSHDYICSRWGLESLRGNKFKSKRASRNYFTKNYWYSYHPISSRDDKDECLKLYSFWAKQRKEKNVDIIYQGLIDDNGLALKEAFDNYAALGFKGGLVRINNKVKGFTFGFELTRDIFCILYEITDLDIKGLAQFIFAQFASQLRSYKSVNIMDDSGLENLKRVKLSYHPKALVASYTIRKNGPVH
ncbi:MAG: DUF2156 domain-containing protein [Candidatus Omnitrophica bacterium]|nr:DUF2156 domain-containing protein [Candidatus Omnitrophota bacterium]